jgi:drug/metabolite transporter (DMT)-like permease
LTTPQPSESPGGRPSRFLLVATFCGLVLVWGTTWAAIRIGLRGIPPWTGAAIRFGLASGLLLAISPAFGVRLGRHPNERRLWAINALCTFSISYGVLYWAEQWVPSGLAAVIFAIFPLCTALLAHVAIPGERLNAGGLLGILLGFSGLAVIFSEDFAKLGGPQVAVAAAVLLIAPASAAVGNVATKRWGSGVHPLSIASVPMGIAALALGTVAAVLERDKPVTFDAASVGALLYLAICGSAITFTAYFWLLRHVSVTSLSFLNYLTPVVAVLVGTIGLGEPLTGLTIAGALLVLAGVGVALRAKKHAAAHAADSDAHRAIAPRDAELRYAVLPEENSRQEG